jgi:hypothetical protein
MYLDLSNQTTYQPFSVMQPSSSNSLSSKAPPVLLSTSNPLPPPTQSPAIKAISDLEEKATGNLYLCHESCLYEYTIGRDPSNRLIFICAEVYPDGLNKGKYILIKSLNSLTISRLETDS